MIYCYKSLKLYENRGCSPKKELEGEVGYARNNETSMETAILRKLILLWSVIPPRRRIFLRTLYSQCSQLITAAFAIGVQIYESKVSSQISAIAGDLNPRPLYLGLKSITPGHILTCS